MPRYEVTSPLKWEGQILLPGDIFEATRQEAGPVVESGSAKKAAEPAKADKAKARAKAKKS